jgi:pumilio RNA-binding family
MLAGGMYGHGGPQTMHGYSQVIRPGRRDGSETSIALRSPLLDEFRANKTRKWDLRVSLCVLYGVLTFVHDGLAGHSWAMSLSSAAINMVRGSFNRNWKVLRARKSRFVFDEIVPNNSLQLIQDVFGNYVSGYRHFYLLSTY